MNKTKRIFVVEVVLSIFIFSVLVVSLVISYFRANLPEYRASTPRIDAYTATQNLTYYVTNSVESESMVATNDISIKPRGQRNILIGMRAGLATTNHNVICIGRDADTTNDYELVIRFDDGTELRQPLPHKNVDMRPWF